MFVRARGVDVRVARSPLSCRLADRAAHASRRRTSSPWMNRTALLMHRSGSPGWSAAAGSGRVATGDGGSGLLFFSAMSLRSSGRLPLIVSGCDLGLAHDRQSRSEPVVACSVRLTSASAGRTTVGVSSGRKPRAPAPLPPRVIFDRLPWALICRVRTVPCEDGLAFLSLLIDALIHRRFHAKSALKRCSRRSCPRRAR